MKAIPFLSLNTFGSDLRIRAWDPVGKVMLDNLCIMQTAFNCLSVAEQHAAERPYTPLLYQVMSPSWNGAVMLWTGREDATGRHIYEADIVDVWSDGLQAVGIVRWERSRAGFFIHLPCAPHILNFSASGDNCRQNCCRVIGNVYQHPDKAPAFS